MIDVYMYTDVMTVCLCMYTLLKDDVLNVIIINSSLYISASNSSYNYVYVVYIEAHTYTCSY